MNNDSKSELNFFKELLKLSSSQKLLLSVPETFISGFGTPGVSLFCTNHENGELIIRRSVSKQTLIDAVNFFEQLVRPNVHIPIGVSKTWGTDLKDRSRLLYTAKECIEVWNMLQSRGKPQVLQKFISRVANTHIYRCRFDVERNIFKKSLIKRTTKTNQPSDKGYFCITRMDEVLSNTIHDSAILDCKMEELVAVVERFYTSDKYAKVLFVIADWIKDTSECFYLISVKSLRVRGGGRKIFIDRPLMQSGKKKVEYSYNDILLKRTLSPPIHYAMKLKLVVSEKCIARFM